MCIGVASASGNNKGVNWPLVLIAFGCVLLIPFLRYPAILIGITALIAISLLHRNRPASPEAKSLEISIRLAADEIADTIGAWNAFLNGPDADSLADRTLYRPALADPYCTDPDIERFRFEVANAEDFLRRLEKRLFPRLSVSKLESLLRVTDDRAHELRTSWIRARVAAKRLGTNYK